MRLELSQKDMEIMEKVSNITGADYEVEHNTIPVENFMYALKDMLYEYHLIEEEKDDLEKDIEDNYEPIRPDDAYYGVSESMFH